MIVRIMMKLLRRQFFLIRRSKGFVYQIDHEDLRADLHLTDLIVTSTQFSGHRLNRP